MEKSKLQLTSETNTDFWNDSCSVEELKYAIENGAVGATANPVIIGEVLKKEMHLWEDKIYQIIDEMPSATEDEIAWKIMEEISVSGAKLLEPIFYDQKGKNGRLSFQTDPKYYRNARKIAEQALYFSSLAPNMIVKIPVTKAGVEAIEEATYKGVSINATICFTVSQCIAVAEAVERGFKRREKDDKDISSMGPVCTVMVGRLDDWLKVIANRDDIVTEPAYLEWPGIAVMKKAYQLFKERGYRIRLLSAATRNHMHWSEFIDGDVVVTLTHQWQKRFNESEVDVIPRIDNPVDQRIIEELSRKFTDFRRAYEEKGMMVDEFDNFGATSRTLRGFISGYESFVSVIRDFMLPNPDK